MALKKFDAEKYLKDGAKTYSLRGEVEALIDRITAKEYDSVCMLGIGGTWAEWYPVVEVAKKYTDLPIYLENAGEFLVKNKKHITDKTLVFTSSASGNTMEILKAVKYCKDQGINVYGFTKDEDGKTITQISKLDREESVLEIARLLGGAEITNAAVENARDMKELADKAKIH